MKGFLIGIALYGGCPAVWAQDFQLMNFKPFTEAAVVLNSGSIVNGSLRFYPGRDVLSLTCANDTTYILPARLVRGFAAKDAPGQQRQGDTYVALQRVFRTLPLPAEKDSATAWGFYEQLSQGPGPILLLRREVAIPNILQFGPATPDSRDGVARPASPSITMYHPSLVATILYLSLPGEKLVRLEKKKHLLKYLKHEAPRLRAYAHQNELQYTKSERDLAFLVDYANKLTQKAP